MGNSGVNAARHPHEPDVLHNERIHSRAVQQPQILGGVFHLAGEDERVERDVGLHAMAVAELHDLRQFRLGEIFRAQAGIEARQAEIDGVRPIGDRGPHAIPITRGSEQFGRGVGWRHGREGMEGWRNGGWGRSMRRENGEYGNGRWAEISLNFSECCPGQTRRLNNSCECAPGRRPSEGRVFRVRGGCAGSSFDCRGSAIAASDSAAPHDRAGCLFRASARR